ncbi:MAG TPA: hypothetical protein VIH78_11780 [Terriglobales bacterium]
MKKITWKKTKRKTIAEAVRERIEANRKKIAVSSEPACIAQEIDWLQRGKMSQTNYVVAAFALDNRCPLNDDLASQLELALSNGEFDAVAVTVNTTVQSNMSQAIGANNCIVQLASPEGTTSDEISAWVTECLEGLEIPTSPPLTVLNVMVF